MKPTARFLKLLFIVLTSALIVFISCEPEVEPDTPNNNKNTINTLSPDELSDHLVLKNSTKINGTLPQAPAGNLKINMKDTIYLVKGKSFGTRIEVKHDGLYEITGFYVGVLNSSFYFDVPIVEEESEENTDVFIFYVDDPDGMDFPFSFPVTILPHVNGIPVKKFVRIVTKEDPEDKEMCSPIFPAPLCFTDSVTKKVFCQCETACWYWIWEFTVVEDNSGDIYRAYAPAMFISEKPYAHGGCCYMGISIPAKDDPYCQSANPEYHEVVVTCHSLIISFPFQGGKWSVVYRRSDVDFNPLQTYFPEYYE